MGNDINSLYEITKPLKIDAFYSFFKVHYKKDFRFDGEIHNFWECVYVIDGGLRVSADDRIYNLSDGDIIFHKPMETHKFTVTHPNGATLLIFSYNLQGKVAKLLKNKVFSLNEKEKMIVSDLLDFTTPQTEEHPEYTLYQYLDTSEFYLERLSVYLYQLFLSLADNGIVSETLDTTETQLFKKAVDYMKVLISSPLTVSDIAKHCAISESGLKRLFKKYAGMSVHKYFLNLKLKTALSMLESGKTVTEVSEQHNFSSQSYFSVAFKRETGKSPSEVK